MRVQVVAALDIALAEQLHHVAVIGITAIAAPADIFFVPGFYQVGNIAIARLNLVGHAPLGRRAHGIADRAAIKAALHFLQKPVSCVAHQLPLLNMLIARLCMLFDFSANGHFRCLTIYSSKTR